MNELVTWLRAQLDEDARVAEAALQPQSWVEYDDLFRPTRPPAHREHIARHGPADVLRDVAAKRAIVDAFATLDIDPTRHDHAALHLQWHVLRTVVQHHASAYTDRPGYRGEWRP